MTSTGHGKISQLKKGLVREHRAQTRWQQRVFCCSPDFQSGRPGEGSLKTKEDNWRVAIQAAATVNIDEEGSCGYKDKLSNLFETKGSCSRGDLRWADALGVTGRWEKGTVWKIRCL